MELKKILTELCNVGGISGYEKNASQVAKELVEPYVDKVCIDKFGSVIGYKYSKNKDAKTIMLDAHIDQIGFVITEITKEGFLRFTNIGGVDPRMLLGLDVFVGDNIRGIVSCMPPHLVVDNTKSTKISDMIIDIGFSQEEALKIVKIGTPIIFAEEVYSITEDSITGKSLDDRAGVACIIYAMEKLKDVDLNVVVCFSAGEERGGQGSMTATYEIKPDFAIAVDVTHAKTPDAPAGQTLEMGKICIAVGPVLHKKTTDKIMKVAKAFDIAYEVEVAEGQTGTNACHIQISRSGVPVSLISIPLKYMHTPIETVKICDIKNTGELIYRFISEFRGNIND